MGRLTLGETSTWLGFTLMFCSERVEKEEDNRVIYHTATMRKNMYIVSVNNDPHLDGINRFLKDALLDDLYFVKPRGWWCRIPDAKWSSIKFHCTWFKISTYMYIHTCIVHYTVDCTPFRCTNLLMYNTIYSRSYAPSHVLSTGPTIVHLCHHFKVILKWNKFSP